MGVVLGVMEHYLGELFSFGVSGLGNGALG